MEKKITRPPGVYVMFRKIDSINASQTKPVIIGDKGRVDGRLSAGVPFRRGIGDVAPLEFLHFVF